MRCNATRVYAYFNVVVSCSIRSSVLLSIPLHVLLLMKQTVFSCLASRETEARRPRSGNLGRSRAHGSWSRLLFRYARRVLCRAIRRRCSILDLVAACDLLQFRRSGVLLKLALQCCNLLFRLTPGLLGLLKFRLCYCKLLGFLGRGRGIRLGRLEILLGG